MTWLIVAFAVFVTVFCVMPFVYGAISEAKERA